MTRELCARCDETDLTTQLCAACFAQMETAFERNPLIVTDEVTLITNMVTSGIDVVYRYKDAKGHYRGTRVKRKYVSIREIAAIVGRSPSYVYRVIKRIDA